MKIQQAICSICMAAVIATSHWAAAKTIVVDGVAVKTITDAMTKLDRNDGDPDVINVTARVVVEPGQVTINGKDPITVNLGSASAPGTIVFPATVSKAGFSIEPPPLGKPCSYTIENGILVPQFDSGLASNAKAAVYFQPTDGSSGFSINLKNLTITASADGNAPVAVEDDFSKTNTNWAHGVEFAPGNLNELNDVSANIANCVFSHLAAYALNLSYVNIKAGALTINLTDSKLVKSDPENARLMSLWAAGGLVVNMTRTELADCLWTLFETQLVDQGVEWNINEGCSIHNFSGPPFLVWPADIKQNITINLNGTESSPVLIYDNKSYCFELGSGREWKDERGGFSLKAKYVKFSNNAGVLKTDWDPIQIAPINLAFAHCEFENNGTQPFIFQRGTFVLSFTHSVFNPAPGVAGLDESSAASDKGTGELDVVDGAITARARSK